MLLERFSGDSFTELRLDKFYDLTNSYISYFEKTVLNFKELQEEVLTNLDFTISKHISFDGLNFMKSGHLIVENNTQFDVYRYLIGDNPNGLEDGLGLVFTSKNRDSILDYFDKNPSFMNVEVKNYNSYPVFETLFPFVKNALISTYYNNVNFTGFSQKII